MSNRVQVDRCRLLTFQVEAAGRALLLLLLLLARGEAQESVAPRGGGGHVAELARYLEQIEIYAPLTYRQLSIFPVRLRGGEPLRGSWLTLDQALNRGLLLITEKGGGGTVPLVVVENRSREDYVFILTGELLAGGKQTRTVRQDLILAPGQRIDVNVFCVEAHRWEGEANFKAGHALAPQSLQQELKRGSEQRRIWDEVARNNAALGAESRTGSLELALRADHVKTRLTEVRERIVPQVPRDTVGLIVVDRDRAVGAEFFGRPDLAQALLPKILDSYSVDLILKRGAEAPGGGGQPQDAAIAFFQRIQRAGSNRVPTAGSGAGMRTRDAGLLGDGVSLSDAVVHYGVQLEDRIIWPPPRPIIEPPRQSR